MRTSADARRQEYCVRVLNEAAEPEKMKTEKVKAAGAERHARKMAHDPQCVS